MNPLQHRSGRITRASSDGRNLRVRAVAYNVVDDYGTVFLPGVFTASLRRRLPVFAWSHDWNEPIGRVTAYDEATDGLYLDVRLSDPAAVPRARQAAAQFADGTLTDVSVGFYDAKGHDPSDDEARRLPGVRYLFDTAGLDEVSAVLRGAVPGAELISIRNTARRQTLTERQRIESLRRSGKLTAVQYEAALKLDREVEEALALAFRRPWR